MLLFEFIVLPFLLMFAVIQREKIGHLLAVGRLLQSFKDAAVDF